MRTSFLLLLLLEACAQPKRVEAEPKSLPVPVATSEAIVNATAFAAAERRQRGALTF